MNKRLLAGAALVVFAASVAAPAGAALVTQFELGFGTALDESGGSVVETYDGGFLAAGAGPVAGQVFVVKTDQNGNVDWQFNYDAFPSLLTAAGAVQAIDGGFLIAGMIGPSPRTGLSDQDGFMIKVDSAGVEEWRTVFGGSADEFVYSVAATDDGGFVVAGATDSPDILGAVHNPYSAYVAKLSSTGSVVRQAAFNQIAATETDEEAFYVIEMSDGTLMVSGICYDPYNWFLLSLDGNLDKRWGAFYGELETQMIAETADGGIIGSGVDYDAEDAFLAKLDVDPGNPSGPLVMRSGWPVIYDGPDYAILYSVTPTPDGGYFAAGHRAIRSDPWDPLTALDYHWAVKYSADGDLLSDQSFAEGDARMVTLSGSDAYAFVGSVANFPGAPGGGDLYLVKLLDTRDPGFVTGTVYFDEDGTCSVTGGETGAALRLVQVVDDDTNATFLTTTKPDGTYVAALPPADYTTSLVPGPANEEPLTCPTLPQSWSSIVSAHETEADQDFHARCECRISQELTGGPIDPAYVCPSGVPSGPCPGFPWEICYHATNICHPLHENQNGANFVSVCIVLPANLVYSGSAPNITTSNCGGTGNWHLQSSSAGQVCFEMDANDTMHNSCEADLCVPVVAAAGFSSGSVTAQFATNQCTGSNTIPAAPVLDYASSCSCDPNAMHVTPEGCGATGDIASQELTYRIDFQNLGAGPAHDVVVTDEFDGNLDATTFRVIDSSHPISDLQLDSDGKLTVRFIGIELPAQVDDDPGSQGHVTVAITPVAGLADGTAIENAASIVFDHNSPVVTNTVTNTIYAGDPVPIVTFDTNTTGTTSDFTYTGGTTGATFAWDFGPDAVPPTSTATSPTGVVFGGNSLASPTPVRLVVTKGACSAEAVQAVEHPCDGLWTTTPFTPRLGPTRAKRVNRRLMLRLKLQYQGVPVTTQTQLDGILGSDFGRVASGDCWPRLRFVNTDTNEELATTAAEFIGLPPNPQPNPDGCLKFRPNGKLAIKLQMNDTVFTAGESYEMVLQTHRCAVHPPNNVLVMRP